MPYNRKEMCFKAVVDLYLSKDFLLNISAEVLGVVLEVFLVTIIIKRYLDRREKEKWRKVFSRKINNILDVHHRMPEKLKEMEMLGDVNIAYRIITWKDIIEKYVDRALAMIPPDYNEPMYKAVEEYQEKLRRASEAFINNSMPIGVLKDIDRAARDLAAHINDSSQKDYGWSKEFLMDLQKELDHLEEW